MRTGGQNRTAPTLQTKLWDWRHVTDLYTSCNTSINPFIYPLSYSSIPLCVSLCLQQSLVYLRGFHSSAQISLPMQVSRVERTQSPNGIVVCRVEQSRGEVSHISASMNSVVLFCLSFVSIFRSYTDVGSYNMIINTKFTLGENPLYIDPVERQETGLTCPVRS